MDVTSEELSWLASFATGESVTAVARRALLSERALYRRLEDLYVRLGASCRAGAVARAAYERAITPSDDEVGTWIVASP